MPRARQRPVTSSFSGRAVDPVLQLPRSFASPDDVQQRFQLGRKVWSRFTVGLHPTISWDHLCDLRNTSSFVMTGVSGTHGSGERCRCGQFEMTFVNPDEGTDDKCHPEPSTWASSRSGGLAAAAASQAAGQTLRHHQAQPALADRHDRDLVRRGRLGLSHPGDGLLLPLHPGLVVHAALPRPATSAQPWRWPGPPPFLTASTRRRSPSWWRVMTTGPSSRPGTIAKSPTGSASSCRGRAIATPTATHWWKGSSFP